ncbi:hypothetical protein PSAB6_300097 [Paraburkholderia sabiae]|nr:hypothetical protein PSAB6_300097 [Paraburkholderia sabiae]
MYRHDFPDFFCFNSVIFAGFHGIVLRYAPSFLLLRRNIPLAVPDGLMCVSVIVLFAHRPIVSCQFLTDLFSLFKTLRN